MAAVEQWGMALQAAEPERLDDKEVVMAAVST